MQIQDDRERELAAGVKVARERLLEAVGGPAMVKRGHGSAGESAKLLEDVAQEQIAALTALGVGARRSEAEGLNKLRTAYIDAVNALWLHAENTGITARLVSVWIRRHRRQLAGIDREEYSAEGTFAMRRAICLHRGDNGAKLSTSAANTVWGALDDYRNRALTPASIHGDQVGEQRRDTRVSPERTERAFDTGV